MADLGRRFWAKVQRGGEEECWIWTACLNDAGYGMIGSEWVGATYNRAHRLSWFLHYGPIPTGMSVLHKCDNPPCVNPAHLELGTHADNMADMKRKRRKMGVTWSKHEYHGEIHHEAKLTTQQAMEAVYLCVSGWSQSRVATRYGVTRGCICSIMRRQTWRHLPDEIFCQKQDAVDVDQANPDLSVARIKD